MNSSDNMQGRAMPRKLPITQMAWSRRIWRSQPLHRWRDSRLVAKTSPTWERLMVIPPTALGMAPTRAPMPQPLSRV